MGDKILLEKDANKCKKDKEGPHGVVQVNSNGTIVYQKGAALDAVNIGGCTPHYEND